MYRLLNLCYVQFRRLCSVHVLFVFYANFSLCCVRIFNGLYDVLNIEFNLWPWVRNMCKYGDFFLALEMAEGKGIVNVSPLSVYSTERLENTDPNNPNYVKFHVEDDALGKVDYENYIFKYYYYSCM